MTTTTRKTSFQRTGYAQAIGVREENVRDVEWQPADCVERNNQQQENIIPTLATDLVTQRRNVVTLHQEPVAKTWKKKNVLVSSFGVSTDVLSI